MHDADRKEYIAAVTVGLCDGMTLERYRAPRGGLHKMRLVHNESKLSVEREYGDNEAVLSMGDDLIVKLQAKLSEKGLAWA